MSNIFSSRFCLQFFWHTMYKYKIMAPFMLFPQWYAETNQNWGQATRGSHLYLQLYAQCSHSASLYFSVKYRENIRTQDGFLGLFQIAFNTMGRLALLFCSQFSSHPLIKHKVDATLEGNPSTHYNASPRSAIFLCDLKDNVLVCLTKTCLIKIHITKIPL